MSTNVAFSIQNLMDAGVHFGHRTMRWNAKMQPYIYGAKNNIHIIDLSKTAPLLHKALGVAKETAEKNGRVLFVATKKQASQIVAEAAERCGQYYVNHRWMGGTLTNWGTVSKSIKTLNSLEERLADPELINKKERLYIQRKITKLQLALGGIRQMGGKPDLLFVIDTNREHIAVLEAKKLGIPVVAIVDTNCDPDGIDYIIPGNDDSIKSIRLYCNLVADSILSGLSKSLGSRASKDKEEAERDASSNAHNKGAKSFKTVNKKDKRTEAKAEVLEIQVEDKDAEAETDASKSKKKTSAPSAKKKTAKK